MLIIKDPELQTYECTTTTLFILAAINQ